MLPPNAVGGSMGRFALSGSGFAALACYPPPPPVGEISLPLPVPPLIREGAAEGGRGEQDQDRPVAAKFLRYPRRGPHPEAYARSPHDQRRMAEVFHGENKIACQFSGWLSCHLACFLTVWKAVPLSFFQARLLACFHEGLPDI